MYDPGLCILASGRKTVRLAGQSFVYDADTFLVLGVPLPVECEVHGSPDNPILGIRVDVDPVTLAELLLDVADAGLPATSPPPPGIYSSRLPDAMRDACLRLIQTFDSPADARILGPSIVREILYRALSTEQAGALRAVATQHARFRQISRALHRIHAEYDRDLSVEDLARDVHMSPSSFHENFRAVTATSPLQYLKAIRLHKARTLMVQDGLGAAVAAARVGYESPSQFSREFKRFFGTTPANEASRARAALAPA
jgi:AraC-like DNA-binding protein